MVIFLPYVLIYVWVLQSVFLVITYQALGEWYFNGKTRGKSLRIHYSGLLWIQDEVKVIAYG